jgi:hypothetical protein
MSAREDILARVRHNRPAGDHALPLIPHFAIQGGEQRLEIFSRLLQAMGGRLCRRQTQRASRGKLLKLLRLFSDLLLS